MDEVPVNPNESKRDAPGKGGAAPPDAPGPSSVFVLTDVSVFHQKVAALLAGDPRLKLVGAASDSREGLREVGELRPDAVLIDAVAPCMDAAILLAGLPADLRAETKVLVVCPGSGRMVSAGPEMHAVVRMKPDSAILKNDVDGERLNEELVALIAGSGDTSGVGFLRTLTKEGVGRNPLSSSELDVLRCAADDLTTSGIARELGRSTSTVKNQRQAILHKFGVHTTSAAVRGAQELGLLPDPRRALLT